MDPQAKILNFPSDSSGTGPSASHEDMPAETPASTTSAVLGPPETRPIEPPPPIWMQRFFLVTMVVFCLWIGFVLAVLPWQTAWTENSFVSNYPNVKWFLGTGFVRGLATGLGLLDLWIGVSEAVQYRDRR